MARQKQKDVRVVLRFNRDGDLASEFFDINSEFVIIDNQFGYGDIPIPPSMTISQHKLYFSFPQTRHKIRLQPISICVTCPGWP